MMTEQESRMLYETHDTVIELAAGFKSFMATRSDTCPIVKSRVEQKDKFFNKSNILLVTIFTAIMSVPTIIFLVG